MTGYDLGQAMAATIGGLIVIAFVAGGALALGGYLLISWLAANVTIGWA